MLGASGTDAGESPLATSKSGRSTRSLDKPNGTVHSRFTGFGPTRVDGGAMSSTASLITVLASVAVALIVVAIVVRVVPNSH